MSHGLKFKSKSYKSLRWQVSIVIPTYNRTRELEVTLETILTQTVLPLEVIIVDDSTTDSVQRFVYSVQNKFEERGIFLKYIKSSRRSSAIARNIGAMRARGDILIFLDDDVILDKKYIEKILKVYQKYPQAKCVQGYIQCNYLSIREKFINFLHKLFLLDHYAKNSCKILPSFAGTYPIELTKIMPCEWISGCNFSCKRDVFLEFLFDEKLKRYSLGEDKDASYRIFKRYPRSLFITPEAKLVHGFGHIGDLKRSDEFSELLAYMSIIYHYYLFTKHLPNRFPYNFLFMWSLLGKIIFNVLGLLFPQSYSREAYKKMLLSQIKALKVLSNHKAEIENGNLSFFDKLFNL